MGKFLHGLLHVLTVAAGLGVAYGGLVPQPYQPLVIAVTGAIQAGLALYNHQSPAVK